VTSLDYAGFLASKTRPPVTTGRACAPSDVSGALHDWQREITAWAVRQGRAAIWAATGLGKSRMQVEWARLSGDRSLIVAPLAVCEQTIREAAAVGVTARYVRDLAADTDPGVLLCNYEMAIKASWEGFDAVVLDEASILRAFDGATRNALVALAAAVPRRLSCTATPMPNDVEELTNQAEWLGIMPRTEMLAAYFVHDSDTGWRLKGHAAGPMWRWMASWAWAIRRPSDMGYDDGDYALPPLDMFTSLVEFDEVPEGQLFATHLGGVGGRARVRRATADARVSRAAELVAEEPDEQWLLWCGLNDEARACAALIPGAVNVEGSWTPEDKARALLDFADGRIRVLVTKTSIAGFGMNFQRCARMAFVGLSDSWEAYYQAVRRCYRYGQTRPVHVHVVLSDLESAIAANIARKEREATRAIDALVAAMTAARLAA